MLALSLSSSSQSLRSRRRRHTAPAPAPPRPAMPASSARTTTAAPSRRDSFSRRRRTTKQKAISTASAAAWRTGWRCRTARSASRHPTDRSRQPAAQAIPRAQHQIGHATVCVLRRPLARVSPRARADVFEFLICFNPEARGAAPFWFRRRHRGRPSRPVPTRQRIHQG
jgi:hypothetical protein